MSAELAPVAREDHPRTVEAMLEQQRGMLNRIAYNYWHTNRRQAELQDFCSVADVAAWKAWKRYDASRGLQLRWWIYCKVHSALKDYVRELVGGRSMKSEAHVRTASVAQVDELEDLLPARAESDPAVAFMIRSRAAEVRAAIDELLTEGQADAVRSMYFGGMSQVEIARRRGCTGGNISLMHERAIEKLRRKFAA